MTQPKTITNYTITAAHRITGRSRTTIQKHLKKGKLSCVEDENGIKRINASELIRVYGDDCDFNREETTTAQPVEPDSGQSQSNRTELHTLRERLDTLNEERRRERERLESEVEHLRAALERAQESGNRTLLLLEDRSGKAEWRESIARLDERLQGHEDQAKAQREKSAHAAWLDMPWWRVLRGKDLKPTS